jgi:hypothetical protein
MLAAICTKDGGIFAFLIFGFALLAAVGMEAMRMPSISFRRLLSGTTNAQKKFQKL